MSAGPGGMKGTRYEFHSNIRRVGSVHISIGLGRPGADRREAVPDLVDRSNRERQDDAVAVPEETLRNSNGRGGRFDSGKSGSARKVPASRNYSGTAATEPGRRYAGCGETRQYGPDQGR